MAIFFDKLNLCSPDLSSRFREALKYRVLRSARLARWLGGTPFLNAHLAHSYWSNYPATTLLFLSSATAGEFVPLRSNMPYKLRVEARRSAMDAQREVDRMHRSLQRAKGIVAPTTGDDSSEDSSIDTGSLPRSSVQQGHETQAGLLHVMTRLGRTARLKIALVNSLLAEGLQQVRELTFSSAKNSYVPNT